MEVKQTTPADIDQVFRLYRSAADYQRIRGYNVWHEFERSLIENEIAAKRHFKIVEGQEIACVFTIAYNDPIIWDEKDSDPAVYLHRIATDPDFKGKGMMHLIKKWAAEHGRRLGKQFLRMDTWGDNENLKNYYVNCGFTFIKQKQLPQPNPLPQHYWGLTLSLFEVPL